MFSSDLIFNALIVVGLVLQLLVLHQLILGAYKKYPLLLVYSLASLAATVAESTRFFSGGSNDAVYQKWYWINDFVLRSLLFLIVISLIASALKNAPNRVLFVAVLSLAAALIIGLSLYSAYDFRKDRFRIPGVARASSNLSFASTLMVLALWAALLRLKNRDWQLLRLTAGLGVSVSGESISYAMRATMTKETEWVIVPNLIAVLSSLLGLYIWWKALRPSRNANAPSPAG